MASAWAAASGPHGGAAHWKLPTVYDVERRRRNKDPTPLKRSGPSCTRLSRRVRQERLYGSKPLPKARSSSSKRSSSVALRAFVARFAAAPIRAGRGCPRSGHSRSPADLTLRVGSSARFWLSSCASSTVVLSPASVFHCQTGLPRLSNTILPGAGGFSLGDASDRKSGV